MVVTAELWRMSATELATRTLAASSGGDAVAVAPGITPLALGLMPNVFWRPLDFGMQRQQLLNLKRLMETA